MALNDFSSQRNEAHTSEYYKQYENAIKNGETRIPICFCIDTSSSMSIVIDGQVKEVPGTRRFIDGNWVVDVVPLNKGDILITRIQELQKVLSKMLDRMKQDAIIAKSAVVCIITFDQFADCLMEFTDVGMISSNIVSDIRIGRDQTNTSKGLNMALKRIEQLSNMNYNVGNDSYRPVIIFMSDGSPTDGKQVAQLRDEIRQRSESGKLNVIPIGIGNDIDERWLRSLTSESRMYHMNTEKDFEDVFEEITKRIQMTTMIISVDENENNMANYVKEGTSSTQYGVDNTSFLNDFMKQQLSNANGNNIIINIGDNNQVTTNSQPNDDIKEQLDKINKMFHYMYTHEEQVSELMLTTLLDILKTQQPDKIQSTLQEVSASTKKQDKIKSVWNCVAKIADVCTLNQFFGAAVTKIPELIHFLSLL